MTAPRDTGSYYDADGHRPPGWVTGSYVADPIVAASGATGGTKVTGWLPAAAITNPQVDRNWNNSFPMQPNDDRNASAKTISTATSANNVTTYTTGTTAHGLSAGQKVTIAGITPVAYNAVNATVLGTPSTTTFTVSKTVGVSYSSGGKVVVNPTFGGGSGDYGWSPTQTFPSVALDASLDSHDIEANAYSGFPAFNTIPRLVGDSVAGATAKIADAGHTLGTVTVSTAGATVMNDGTVKSQSPVGGDGATGTTTINLVVFDVSGTLNTVVPNIVGLVATAANAALTAATLTAGTVTTTATGATALNDGQVKTQTPAANTVVDINTAVNYVLYSYTP